MELREYLARIDYNGPVQPTEEVLDKLCWCHVTHIPFYTLDLFSSTARKVMDLAVIYRNLVQKKVGGLCYELNGLFSWLLRKIGFHVDVIRTEALTPNGEYGGSLVAEHLTLIVTLPGGLRKIADVSALALPLRFDTDEPQYQRNTKARAIKSWCDRKKAWYICVEKLERSTLDKVQKGPVKASNQAKWKGRFRFQPDAKNTEITNFQDNLDATMKAEESVFKTMSFCVLQNEVGFKGLIGTTYMEKEYIDDFIEVKRTRVVNDRNELMRILQETFNIEFKDEMALPELRDDTY